MSIDQPTSENMDAGDTAPALSMPDHFTQEQIELWTKVLRAGVEAQRIVPQAVVAGGAAAALYARHRLSVDTDHLLGSLNTTFDEVLDALERHPDWTTARIQRPVLILGSLDDVPVGVRQTRRQGSIEVTQLETPWGKLTIPTLDELLAMKAYLAYSRNSTRDYLDFAALSLCTHGDAVLESLMKLDERYGHLQTASVALEVAKSLAKPMPYDLAKTDLVTYKGLAPPWHDWRRVEEVCRMFGVSLGQRLVQGEV